MAESYLSANAEGIGALIEKRRQFKVPDHQRDYAWTRDEVAQLLDDVQDAIARDAPEYFLGLIVLQKPQGGEAWGILDGQQRLATVSMIYAAVREWLSGAGEEKEAHKLQGQFVGFSDIGDQEDHARLTLNVNDRKTFQDCVVSRANDDALRDRLREEGRFSSGRRLLDAALLCRERVRDIARKAGSTTADQATKLYALAKYLRDRVTVVCMDVESAANAYVVFESLNDRGLDLSVLDLVKNSMFGRASGPQLPTIQRNWSVMVANLGDRQGDDFLKAFWTSRYGRIQRGRLFQEWRDKYSSPDEIRRLSDELVAVAERYAALGTSDHEMWVEYGRAAQENVKVLALLGNQQVRPVLLAALEKADQKFMERLLELLVVLTVRYQVIGRGRTGALEIACAKVASMIFKGQLNSAPKVWRELAPLVPQNEAFRHDFARHTETKAPRARYLLRELERTARGGKDSELSAAEGLTLEHILPRNASSDWQDELKADSDLRLSVDRLGNLCLLTEKQNRKLGSHGFAEKAKCLYKNSELFLTASVEKKFKHWDRSAIDSRQAHLAELAVQTWPLPQVQG